MQSGRPYATNYAIGIIIVMGFHMIFNSLSALIYPEAYESDQYTSAFFQYLFIGASIWEFLLAAGLYVGSGIAHKLSVLSMFLIALLTCTNMVIGGRVGFDIWFQTALSFTVLIILLLPVVRRYYHNWSLGTLPSIHL